MKTASQSESLIRYAMIGLLMLAILIFVVRPLSRKLQLAGTPQALPGGADPALAAGQAQPTMAPEQLVAEKQKQHAQVVFDQVLDHLRRDPAQSTRLLQSWIHTE